jgi:hypothetical protein
MKVCNTVVKYKKLVESATAISTCFLLYQVFQLYSFTADV